MNYKKVTEGILFAGFAAVMGTGLYTFQNSVSAASRLWNKDDRKEPDPDTPKGKLYFERKKAKEEMQAKPYEDVYVTSFDGLKLHGYLYPKENASRIVILCHGFHGSPASDFCFIFPMLENDCTILAIDERSGGESEGKYITFGAKEKTDIKTWARWMNSHNPKRLPLYLFGVSMGAASVLMNADDGGLRVNGIISDCGYTNMNDIISDVQKQWYGYSLRAVRLALDFWCRTLAGFRMKDADAMKALENAKIPVLFFHGENDNFVSPKHTEKNASVCASPHETVLIPEAGHTASSRTDPTLYESRLREFFAEYDA